MKFYSYTVLQVLIVGIVVRLSAVFFSSKDEHNSDFSEFATSFVINPSFFPWDSWIESGGAIDAFPYGLTMLLSLVPAGFIFNALGVDVSDARYLTFIMFEAICGFICLKTFEADKAPLVAALCLSPITIFISYVLGHNDIIPITFMIIGLYFLKSSQFALCGLFFAFAVSAKVTMLISLPILAIFVFNNARRTADSIIFSSSFLFFSGILALPSLLSANALTMVTQNIDLLAFLQKAKSFRELDVPLILQTSYFAALYLIWRGRRFHFLNLIAILSVVLLVYVLFFPASPGWFVWLTPFLAFYFSVTDKRGKSLIALFSCVVTMRYYGFDFAGLGYFVSDAKNAELLNLVLNQGGQLFLASSVSALGIVMAVRIFRNEITNSFFYKNTRSPLLFLIAGDSSTGKTTLAKSLTDLFGEEVTTNISGDDFHIYDRNTPMWRAVTHLHPKANNLALFANAVKQLKRQNSMLIPVYDHGSGKFGSPKKVYGKNVVVASGLHAISDRSLDSIADLKIFLHWHEGLRRYTKIKRDVTVRNRSLENVKSQIEQRSSDSEEFIQPQKEFADLVFYIEPVGSLPEDIVADNSSVKLQLRASSKIGFGDSKLEKALVGLCGKSLSRNVGQGGVYDEIIVQDDFTAKDIEVCAKILVGNMEKLISTKPSWRGGLSGVMQVIVLSQIEAIKQGS